MTGGTASPKLVVRFAMSVVSEKPLLVVSAGQASVPQWARALVPMKSSSAVLNASQSGSLAGTDQGSAWVGFGQVGQLSERSNTPSPS